MVIRYPDAYHSCYTLAGLSSAQHDNSVKDSDSVSSENYNPLKAPFQWISPEAKRLDECEPRDDIYDAEDEVNPIHPIFAVPWSAVERMYNHYGGKVGF